jgi:acetyl-CoA carboxylase biotin carboxyl carrier protein
VSDAVLVLRVRRAGETSDLLAPSVGIFTAAVAEGELVSAGQSVGTLDVLGVLRELTVPDGVAGRITDRVGGGRSRVPVQYGEALLAISTASVGKGAAPSTLTSADARSGLSFVAPMSGRFYGRPSPGEPPFVTAGDTVVHGQTIGLLEVMKTFNRLVYQGDAVPERAAVEQIVPADGDDVVRGAVILALGSLPEK